MLDIVSTQARHLLEFFRFRTGADSKGLFELISTASLEGTSTGSLKVAETVTVVSQNLFFTVVVPL